MALSKPIKHLRTNIFTGTFILLPLVTTMYVFYKLFILIDSILPNFFHSIMPFIPAQWFPGVGALVIILVAMITGLLARNIIGRSIISTVNRMIATIPVINTVYVGIQQVLDAVVKSEKKLFKRTVLVEYPQKNSYAIAFLTSVECGEIQRKISPDIVGVFVPTTPNPTSGFLLYVNRTNIIELDMNIETAMKLIMSAGVVNPDTLRRTERLYQLHGYGTNHRWLNIFKRSKHTPPSFDPRD